MSLALPCVITVCAETAFFALCGYRRASFLALCALVNTVTNLTLNLVTPAVSRAVDITYFIYALEAAVTLAEYLAFALAVGPAKKLLLLTAAANALSYTLGVIIYGHI